MIASRATLRAFLARTSALRPRPQLSAPVARNGTSVNTRCLSSLLGCSAPTPLVPNAAPARGPARRFFSSDDGSSAVEDLSSLLSRELEEEESTGSTKMSEELSDLLARIEEEWRVVDGGSALGGGDGGGSGTVRLFKKSAAGGGAKVGIAFHCQDTIADDEAGQQDGGGFGAVEEDEEEEEEESVAVRFTTTVTRAGKTLVLSCVSENAEATVEGVALVEGDADSVSKGVDESLYQGPEFSELAEDLQESFTVYLQEELGIDGDVSAFIAMYADYREEMEYVGWLKGVQSMIQ